MSVTLPMENNNYITLNGMMLGLGFTGIQDASNQDIIGAFAGNNIYVKGDPTNPECQGYRAEYIMYLYDDLSIYTISVQNLAAGREYDVDIKGLPYETVYLTYCSEFQPDNVYALEKNSATINYSLSPNGTYSIQKFKPSQDGYYVFWMKTNIENMIYNLSSILTVTVLGEGVGYYACSGPEQVGTYTVNGNATSEMEIKVTCPTTTNSLYVVEFDAEPTDFSEQNIKQGRQLKTYTSANELAKGTASIQGVTVNTGKYIVVYGYINDDNPSNAIEITEINGYSSTCLAGDTLITMADNSKQRLDTIKVGDFVKTETGISRVYQTRRSAVPYPNKVNYYFDDGSMVSEVHVHPFFNVESNFFKIISQWEIGEHAINEKGELTALVRKEVINEPTHEYGIWTEEGTWYANGLLTSDSWHNKIYFENMTAEELVNVALTVEPDILSLIFNGT